MQKSVSIKAIAKREANLVHSTLDKDKCERPWHLSWSSPENFTFKISGGPVRKEIFVFSKHLPIISFFNLDLSERSLVSKDNMLKLCDRTHSHWQWCFSPILTPFNIPNHLNLRRLRRFLTEGWTKLSYFSVLSRTNGWMSCPSKQKVKTKVAKNMVCFVLRIHILYISYNRISVAHLA